MRSRLRLTAAGAVVLAAAAGTPALAAGSRPAASVASAPALLSSIPAWAHGLRSAAAEPAASRVDVVVLLRGRNSSELPADIAAVSTPGSSSYRHFMTEKQYAATFAPAAASTALVKTWLAAQGLTVDQVTPQGDAVAAHGTAAAVGKAFHVGFTRVNYEHSLRRVPTSEPTLPTGLRGVVAGVAGLAAEPMHSNADPAPSFFNARPCSTYFGQKKAKSKPGYGGKKLTYTPCGYTPKQLRSAYGINTLKLSGKGASVGIVDTYATPDIVKDADTYSRRHGLPKLSKGQLTQHTQGSASNPPEVSPGGLGVVDPNGWAGEETLDVEAVHALAPKAKIQYYAASTNFGTGLEMEEMTAVQDAKSKVISNSWGSTDDSPDPVSKTMFDDATNQAAMTGITIDVSSGDDGDETDPTAADGARTADFPATSTGVTAVGGTTTVINKHGHVTRTTYWGTYKTPLVGKKYDYSQTIFNGAGGGGVSTEYAEKSYQKKVVPSSEATYGKVPAGRVEPDVSMDADATTGMLIGQTQTPTSCKARYSEYRIGGTSLACPLFSALVALAVEKNHGKGLGLITPTLYHASGHAASRKKLFLDPSGVKTGTEKFDGHHQSLFATLRPDYTTTDDKSSKVTYSLRTLGNLETLHHRKGYDDSTGLGVPKAAALIKLLK